MGLVLLLSLSSAALARAQAPAQAGPADLTLRYVERLPRLDYVWGSENPEVEGWPRAGETVTWRAHLYRFLEAAAFNVEYWLGRTELGEHELRLSLLAPEVPPMT